MHTLELLLSKRWILKERDRELYYRVKDELGTLKKFLMEKLGYQVVVNPYLIKVEKIPAKLENWMGIQEFTEPIEYVFFCLILMFLEDKEAEEQFILSSLTEYIQGQYREVQIDWTVYSYRRHLVKVMKYCVAIGILQVDDGSEESFARDDTNEVLYENTGTSRYFMRTFTQDIMDYQTPEDFLKEEWIAVDEDRGIVRRQRVYRSLLMSMGLYRREETEEDFAYIKNYRNMIQGELSELFDCELHVHRNSAFLILGEECRLGRTFPEENTLSDIVLLCSQLLREEIEHGNIAVPTDECISLSIVKFRTIIEACKETYGNGFIKTYREMMTEEFYQEVLSYMKQMEFIEMQGDTVFLSSALGKIVGRYPKDFFSSASVTGNRQESQKKNGGTNE